MCLPITTGATKAPASAGPAGVAAAEIVAREALALRGPIAQSAMCRGPPPAP
jgi:hypothetical protein